MFRKQKGIGEAVSKINEFGGCFGIKTMDSKTVSEPKMNQEARSISEQKTSKKKTEAISATTNESGGLFVTKNKSLRLPLNNKIWIGKVVSETKMNLSMNAQKHANSLPVSYHVLAVLNRLFQQRRLPIPAS